MPVILLPRGAATAGLRGGLEGDRFGSLVGAKFSTEVSRDVEMNPPHMAGVVRVAASHGIAFVL